MSYWHNDSAPEARQSGKRMASQYILPTQTITASPSSNNNASFIRTVQQSSQSSPFQNEFSSTAVIRRTKPGGDNVRRTAEANDRRFHQMEVNRESQQTQQLASWHSLHEKQNKQGERRRNEKQLGEDLQVANAELKLQRRSKLRVLLEQEQQQYKRELAAKGLAILYDEP